MDSRSSDHLDSPKRLKTLASNVKYSGGNVLLHQFVLDNSHPNDSGSEIYVRAVLLSMSDVPASAVNALNDEGFTALHLAVLKNNLKMVEKLLSCLTNIDVNARGGRDNGNTALHLAVESGHLSIVQELLKKGASIDIRNRNYETALCVAMRLHNLDIVKNLVGADVNQRNARSTPLRLAARHGSLEIAEFLIDAGADIDARGGGGRTPLHDAVFGRNLDIVKLLVGKGADLNARDEFGQTPLHFAVLSKELEYTEFLSDQGAHLDATDLGGFTPLHIAACEGHAEVVIALLDRGADVNARDVGGRTPLHYAAHGGHVDVLLALLDTGADANARWNGGRSTPLDIARARKNQSCIDALQSVGQ